MQQPAIQLPILPQPLFVPHIYDDSHKVHVQLDQPLWSEDSSNVQFISEILSFCVQLDALILSQSNGEFLDFTKKTVTFQHGFTSKVVLILEKMSDKLCRRGITSSVEGYLSSSGLAKIFPRVVEYLRNPSSIVTVKPSELLEGYYARVTALNNLLVLSQQLQKNVQTSVSHKYIAHQLALLYQSIGAFGEPFMNYKKEIESRFAEVKAACTPSDSSIQAPRLSTGLQNWLTGLTSDLTKISTSLNSDLSKFLIPVVTLAAQLDSIST